MHLVRTGEALSGTYAYTRVGRDLALSGTISPSGDVAMKESVDGKTTGEFAGKLEADGSLAGTWSTPGGAKKLPFAFKESSGAAAVPASATTTRAQRRPVAPSGTADWVTLYSTIASMNGVKLAPGELEAAVKNGSPPFAFQQKMKAPFTDIGALYFADIDNDGSPEYVLCDTNSVGLHNSYVVAVYHPHNGVMTSAPLPASAPFDKTPTFLASPFLSVDPEGTTMSFVDGTTVERYLWKGSTVRLLDRTPERKL